MINDKFKKNKVIDIIRKSSASDEFENQEQIKITPNIEEPVSLPEKKIHKQEKEPIEKIFAHQNRPLDEEDIEAEEGHPIKETKKDAPFLHQKKKIFKHKERREEPISKIKIFTVTAIILLVLGGSAYASVSVLPKTDIKVTIKKVKWDYNNSININPKIADIDSLSRQVPAAVFSQTKNQVFSFPASGSKYLQRKATGSVIIYNDSSAQQVLVAGTRLQTPDGKIFRLKDRLTVPASTGDAAGTITADVIADQAGDSYNISPVEKFSIPGFSGTDKYDKFYAQSKAPMTGGFIGNGKYPTPDDILKAKTSAENQMKDVLNSFLYSQVLPQEFKVIDSSKQIKITREVVNEATDADGNFTVFVEAQGSLEAIKEAQVLALMNELAKQVVGDDFQIKESKIDYGDIAIDQKTQAISLPVNFHGIFWKPVDIEDFKSKALNKSEDDIKSLIFSYSSIEKADISFWPFWVKTVPSNPEKVKVTVE